MEMPKPTEAHRKLELLAGNWRGEETMHPSPWDPQGGKAQARMQSRVAIGGFAVIGDYEQERNGVVTFTGHSVFTYNPQDGNYHLYWFDCMGMPPNHFVGRLEGDILTVTDSGPMGHHRLTYNLSKKGQLVSKMEMSQDGKQWNTLFDGTYSRQ